jgi:hypothetical protein
LLGLSTGAGNSIQHRESETGRQSQQRANKSNRAGEGVHPRRRKTERENLTGAQNRIEPGPCLAEELNSERETLTEEITTGSQRLKNEKQRPDLALKTLAAESIQAAENKTEDLSSKNEL